MQFETLILAHCAETIDATRVREIASQVSDYDPMFSPEDIAGFERKLVTAFERGVNAVDINGADTELLYAYVIQAESDDAEAEALTLFAIVLSLHAIYLIGEHVLLESGPGFLAALVALCLATKNQHIRILCAGYLGELHPSEYDDCDLHIARCHIMLNGTIHSMKKVTRYLESAARTEALFPSYRESIEEVPSFLWRNVASCINEIRGLWDEISTRLAR